MQEVSQRQQLLKGSTAPLSAGPSSFLDCSRVLLPAPVFAHGLVGRADLPIPEVAVRAPPRRRCSSSRSSRSPRCGRRRGCRSCASGGCSGCRVAVDVVLGAHRRARRSPSRVYAGLAGTDAEQDNLAPTVVFVLLLGRRAVRVAGVRRRLPAAQPVARDRARGRLGRVARVGAAMPEPLAYPERARAAGRRRPGIFVFGDLRAVLGRRRASRRRWRCSCCSTSSSMFVGMSLYGVEPWTRNADPFGVYFGLFALPRAGRRRRDGVLYARPPVVGATRLDPRRGHGRAAARGDRHHGVRRRQRGPALQHDRAAPPGLLRLARASTRATALELAFLLGLVVIVLVGGDLLGRDLGAWASAGCGAPMTRIELGRSLRAHAGADRRRLRRRALLLAARLQRPGHLAAGLRPARRRQRPVRRRRTARSTTPSSRPPPIWYVQVGALVDRPRRRARARPRPRAGALRRTRRRRPARRSSCWS